MIYTVTVNPSIDYIVQLNELTLGEVNRMDYDNKLPGGKGINVSRILKELAISSLVNSGPRPLISVSAWALILTLIRVSALIGVKFVLSPVFSKVSLTNSPVKPPKKPQAVLSKPSSFKIRETLIPLPPGNLLS